jgi:hypothetical protein
MSYFQFGYLVWLLLRKAGSLMIPLSDFC